VANDNWETLGKPAPLKIVKEEIAGLSNARLKGMASASYDCFLFCDDDNWLDSNYLQIVYNNFNSNPKLGALGGWCHAKFEVQKPVWFDTFSGNFAVGKSVKSSGYLIKPEEYIYGAGMVISRKAKEQLDLKGFENILSDRKGKTLSSGGDVEICYALKLLGIPVLFDENLHFYHFMQKGRLNREYLLKLRESMYWSNFVLSIYVDAQKKLPYNLLTLIKKVLAAKRQLKINTNKLKNLEQYDALFLMNQIQVRKLFLNNLLFYIRVRKKLELLNHA
jgi:glycosyltransferase involved in cell wall biosynthesis